MKSYIKSKQHKICFQTKSCQGHQWSRGCRCFIEWMLILRIVRLVLIYVMLVKKRELLFFSIIFKYKIYENLELVLGKNVNLQCFTSVLLKFCFCFQKFVFGPKTDNWLNSKIQLLEHFCCKALKPETISSKWVRLKVVPTLLLLFQENTKMD